MRIVNKPRASGKTYGLVKKCKENNGLLIVSKKSFAVLLGNRYGLRVFNPYNPILSKYFDVISIEDFVSYRKSFTIEDDREILVDEIGMCLELLIGTKVSIGTTTAEE